MDFPSFSWGGNPGGWVGGKKRGTAHVLRDGSVWPSSPLPLTYEYKAPFLSGRRERGEEKWEHANLRMSWRRERQIHQSWHHILWCCCFVGSQFGTFTCAYCQSLANPTPVEGPQNRR